MTPKEVLGTDQAARGHDGRSAVHGFSRGLAAFLDTCRRPHRGNVRGGHRRSTAPAWWAGVQSTRPICWSFPSPRRHLIDPFPAQPTLTMICNIHDPITHQDYTRDPATSPARPSATCATPGWPNGACWPRSSSFSSSTTCGSSNGGTRRSITSIRWKGPGTEAGPSVPTWVTSRVRVWATSPARPPTAWWTSAPRWPSEWPNAASRRRPTSTKSPPAASARSTSMPQAARGKRRPGHAGQVHHPQRRSQAAARPRHSCPSLSSATTARACTRT